MPGENPIQPASAAAPAAPVAPAAPAVPAAPASAAPAAPAPAAAPSPILGADPSAPDPAKAADPAKDPAAAAPVVPEKYELKAPEGLTLDATALDAFTPVFKELGLTQAQAQKLVDAQGALTAKAAEAANKKMGDDIAAETAAWAKASREDKEFGGANFEANAKIANQALAAFGTEELKKELTTSGYANHPAFVRLFWQIGQKLGESTAPAHGNPPASAKSAASVLYPSMNPTH
jgi:hypothetical protein